MSVGGTASAIRMPSGRSGYNAVELLIFEDAALNRAGVLCNAHTFARRALQNARKDHNDFNSNDPP